MRVFDLVSENNPAGDQPKAIESLVRGVREGMEHQTLLGVTGSGKTFTIAHVINEIQCPTLVLAHNKTLAAQLCNELRELFPNNAVHYFVSYYDYYQPEAYLPTSDTYIEKEAMINDEIDKLRHAATAALLTRRDVIIVASVSCIYGLGAPETYAKNIIRLGVGDVIDRPELTRKLVGIQFSRTTSDLKRGTFRTRGERWEIMPPDREVIYDLEVKEGKIQKIWEIDPVRGFMPGVTPEVPEVLIAPAKHFVTEAPDRVRAVKLIKAELKEQLEHFEKTGKLLEAERLERRTKFDTAMIREVGYCHGIENYSRHLSGRAPGEPPDTLLDYFPDDFLTVIDESHVTIPQLEGMHAGDAARKKTLIEFGFRLPSAADNRPLTFKEFNDRVGQIIFTSATPGSYERTTSSPNKNGQIVEQIIRPTGLIDPKITILPARGQVDDLIPRIKDRVARGDRVLVTTLTKRMAEDLSSYLEEGGIHPVRSSTKNGSTSPESISRSNGASNGIKVTYLHSDVKTLDRIRILTDLRQGKIDVLVGVNLLREGLDLPEVSLVAILDADKEGFLRSETSLVQTIGRAARNVDGEVLMYADEITGSIDRAVRETERRRKIQIAYNAKHGITPRTVIKAITNILPVGETLNTELAPVGTSRSALLRLISQKEKEMRDAAHELNFELATLLRDEIGELSRRLKKKETTKSKKTNEKKRAATKKPRKK